MATKYWIGTTDDWNTAGNWSPSGVPTTGDTAIIADSSQDIAAFDASAVLLSALHIHQSYTGLIGDNTSTGYLQVGATKCCIGYQPKNYALAGSQRIKLDLGSNQSDVRIYDSANSSADTGKQPIRLLCNHASTTIAIHKGSVGVAADGASETSQANQITANGSIGYDVNLVLGKVTLASFKSTGGQISLTKSPTLMTIDGGTVTLNDPDTNTVSSIKISGQGSLYAAGAFGITSISVYGGVFYANATGTISNLNLFGGLTSFTLSDVSRTVTDALLNAGCTLHVDTNIVTFTNPIQLGILEEIRVGAV